MDAMMRARVACSLLVMLIAAGAGAQPRSITDPDDFINPDRHNTPIFISRLVAGGISNSIDGERPMARSSTFLHLTNSLYLARWQFDYKHSEVPGTSDAVQCPCNPPIYFPAPPPPDATPAPPPPGSKDTVQFGLYRSTSGARRYRLTISEQRSHTTIRSVNGEVLDHRSGHERSIALDADLRLHVGKYYLWGSLIYGYSATHGPIVHRTQQELAYTARPPGWSAGRLLVRPTLTVAGVTNRGGTAINVVNPAFEAFWHDRGTKANLHLVWSPQAMRDGVSGWQTHHQIALFADRELFVHIFR